MPSRILIVDDHEIVREGIRTLLARERPGWEICGEVASGREALEAVRQLHPDVVILDVTMPTMSGLEVASRLGQSDVHCRILMFTMHDSPLLGKEVSDAGAHGLVLKSQASRDLVIAVESLLTGGTFFHPFTA